MKCLSQDRINSLQGNVIHDSHAEILALRAFNRFLLDQCSALAAGSNHPNTMVNTPASADNLLEWCHPLPNPDSAENLHKSRDNLTTGLIPIETLQGEALSTNQHPELSHAGSTPPHGLIWQGQPFRIRSGIKIHMYCSEAPCGDSSMELTMASQQDATPWSRSPPPQSVNTSSDVTSEKDAEHQSHSPSSEETLYGRSYFDVLGVVRRKPSRPDAPPTLSKSCSDKIALKQCTSILSSITSLLVHPGNAYIQTLILPGSQHIEHACQRAFGPKGRMATLVQACDQSMAQAGYSYRPFEVKSTTREFSFSRRTPASIETASVVPSNISSLTHGKNQETLINGVLQGRKQADPKGASAVSRRKMWSLALNIAVLIGQHAIPRAMTQPTYHHVKCASLLRGRDMVKKAARHHALKGWKRNTGDDSWGL